jgi:hypothetical protein
MLGQNSHIRGSCVVGYTFAPWLARVASTPASGLWQTAARTARPVARRETPPGPSSFPKSPDQSLPVVISDSMPELFIRKYLE